VNLLAGAQISTTGSGTSVNITGTGGGGNSTATNNGLQIQGCSTLSNVTITSNGGPIVLNATEGNGTSTRGIVTSSSAVIGNATTPGNITVLTNSAVISTTAGSAINAAGSLSIAPITAGVGVNLGSITDTVGGPLVLSTEELATFNTGTIQIGNTNTGNFWVMDSTASNVTVPVAANLTLISNSTPSTGITSYRTLNMGAGKLLDISALPSVNTIIDAGDPLNTEVRVVGNLSIAGKSLNLSGNHTPVSGEVYIVANSTSLTGTFTGQAEGSTITLNGQNLTVNYTPTSVTLTASSSTSAPSITTQPATIGKEVGQTASFTASSSGSPTPTVQWQVKIGAANWADINLATSATYSFTAALGDQGNQYQAVFTNTAGTATTNPATLDIGVTPVFTSINYMTIPVGLTSGITVIATGVPAPQYTIVSGSLPSGVTLDPVTGLFAGSPAGGTAGSYPVTIQALNGIGTAPTQNFSLTVTSTVTSFVVSRGAAQRSYVRYLDLGMDSNASALALLNNPSRVKLTKADLNGVGAAPVPLAGFLSVPSGQSTLAVNFGTIGLGNSRNTSTADGYYTLGVDLDGNGTFETNLFFFRLFGDTNGDREVTATDQSAVLAGCTAAYDANLDLNGDGVVNTSDLNYVKRNVGRKLKNTLIVTS
jgi:hypothetical protein